MFILEKVAWITVLDSVPEIDMLDWLPGNFLVLYCVSCVYKMNIVEFLDGIFNMLSDGNREIRQV